MILKSFATIENKIATVEVELILLPGLPQIHFLGMADQGIKELDRKIRSAIRNQGFEFPKAQQIIVNLRPVHLKKKSKGLDLAIAVALLMETKQIPKIISSEDYYVYGELNLMGQVQVTDDLESLPVGDEALVLTANSENNCLFQRSVINNLKDLLKSPQIKVSSEQIFELTRPIFGIDLKYSENESRLIKLISLMEHNTLLAGPPGTGKSTLAKSIPSFLRPPQKSDWQEIKQIFPEKKIKDFSWRAIVQPHHSNTVISLLGGGVPVRPGDLSRAHKGVLIMDEFLEFDARVQEALREPVEEGVLRLSRKTQQVELPTAFLLLATTNLCPCGHWIPDAVSNCIRSRARCQSVRQKLSGPLLDRFDIVYFKTEKSNKRIKGQDILNELESLRKRVHEKPIDINSLIAPNSILKLTESQRRITSISRVALSLSYLNQLSEVGSQEWEEALDYSFWPMLKLNKDLGSVI